MAPQNPGWGYAAGRLCLPGVCAPVSVSTGVCGLNHLLAPGPGPGAGQARRCPDSAPTGQMTPVSVSCTWPLWFPPHEGTRSPGSQNSSLSSTVTASGRLVCPGTEGARASHHSAGRPCLPQPPLRPRQELAPTPPPTPQLPQPRNLLRARVLGASWTESCKASAWTPPLHVPLLEPG